MCCVRRRPCASTRWIRVQLTIWRSPDSLCPQPPPPHHGNGRPAFTQWNMRTRRGSSPAGATAGATAIPLHKNTYLSRQPVALSQKQILRRVWRYQFHSVTPEQPAPFLAQTPPRSQMTLMQRSAVLTALFTLTRNLPAPRTKADTSPRVPGSTGAASAIRCPRFQAGTGSNEWARRPGRSQFQSQPN